MQHALVIAAACLLALLSTIGAALPYPILPPLFAAGVPNGLNQFLGLPPNFLFSMALLVNPLGLLVGSAIVGPLSDRYGRRPTLMVTGLGAALGHAITALALVLESYPLFVAARFITGLLEGNSAVARALLAERLEGELRVRAMSWLNGAFFLGWLAGPLLAGLTVVWGITVPFWIAAGALVLASLLVALALPREAASLAGTSWWQVVRDKHVMNLLRHTELRMLFIVMLAYYCGVTAFYEFYPLWLVEVPHFGTQEIAWITALLCGVMTLTSLVAGRRSAVLPLRRASWSALALAMAVAGVAFGNAWVGMAAIILFGIPNAIYNAVVPAWCAERFGSYGQGAVMGLLSTTFCLANILMALAGAALTLVDTRMVLLLGALLTAWAGWRLQGWRVRMAATTTNMGS